MTNLQSEELKLKSKTVSEFLEDWDDGKPVVVVSMGGMGDLYEHCIWCMAVEMIRAIKDMHIDWPSMDGKDGQENWKGLKNIMEAGASNAIQRLQPSSAQVGAAFNISAVIVRNGYGRALEMAGEDRLIIMNL